MEKPGAKNAEAVRQILETLVVCERPLSKQEIHENLRCDSRGFNDKLDVWRMVPALLQLAGESSSFMDLCLVHGSLKEFLQSKELEGSLLGSLAVDEATAQRNITRRCVVDLLKYQQPSSYTSKFGWTAYAGRYWHKHAKKMARGRPYSHEAAIWRDCTRLLRPNTASFAHWTYMTGTDGGVDRDEQGDLGKKEGYPSPLYYAALLGLLPCAEDLIYQGESVNVSGGKHRSPLLAAVATGEIDLVKLLLEKGADPECRYANGDTALIRAVKIGRKEVFNLLLQAGVDLDASNDKRRMTAAHWAVQYDRPVLLESLLIAGAGADILDDLGRTLLHWAVQHDNITNTKLLSCTTNNLAVRDSQGLTPLHVAAGGSEQALEVLLEQKTAVKVLDAMTDDGKNALCIAAEGVNVGIVQKLIKKRASPMMLGPKCHTTSLHFAAAPLPDMENAPCGLSLDEVYEAKRQIVKLLLTHGADPWWRDSEWKRPEDVTEDPVIKKILQHSRGRLDSIESASRSE